MALTHQTTKMNLTLLTNDKTLRTQSESTSTDKTFASTESESVQQDTVKNYSERNRLQKRLLEIEGLMDSHELCLLDNRERRLISFKLTKATKKIKRLLNEQLRLDDEVRERYDRLELQYLDTLRDLNSLMSSQSFVSQSKPSEGVVESTLIDSAAPTAKLDKQPSQPELISRDVVLAFLDEFPLISPQDLTSRLCEIRDGNTVEMIRSLPDILAARTKNYTSIRESTFQSNYETLLLIKTILAVVEVPKGIDSDKLESLDQKDSPPPKPTSAQKRDESELRRLKTLIKQVSSWEQLDWRVPLRGFTKVDYQPEVVRRTQLAAGSSKKHARIDKWVALLNDHYAKYDDNGNQRQGLVTMSTKASRKATGFKPSY